MSHVKLMDRVDTKFMLSFDKLNSVLANLRGEYKLFENAGTNISSYKNLYYDTPDLNLYLAHHNGQLNRFKIRHRIYTESGNGFLEVKFKSNKKRMKKERIQYNSSPLDLNEEAKKFLRQKTDVNIETLSPVIYVNYKRITLVSKNIQERVTLDFELCFNRNGKTHLVKDLVIAEVKQDKQLPSFFTKLMKDLAIREGSLSKYCTGIALLHPTIKKNNFKEKLSQINKLTNKTVQFDSSITDQINEELAVS